MVEKKLCVDCDPPWWAIHTDHPTCQTVVCENQDPKITMISDTVFSMSNHCDYIDGTRVNQLQAPRGLCYDSQQSLLVCDYGSDCVWRKHTPVDPAQCGWWENVLSLECIPGGLPSCVVLVADKYLLVSSGVQSPYYITCTKYSTQSTEGNREEVFI